MVFLNQLPAQIFQAVAANQQLLPLNPNLTSYLQAKIALLQKPGLATEITNLSYYAERTVQSSDGRAVPLLTFVFLAEVFGDQRNEDIPPLPVLEMARCFELASPAKVRTARRRRREFLPRPLEWRS